MARCFLCEKFLCSCIAPYQEGRIRAWRSNAPPPEITIDKQMPDSGVKGHAHLHPRGMKHKRFRVMGVKVR